MKCDIINECHWLKCDYRSNNFCNRTPTSGISVYNINSFSLFKEKFHNNHLRISSKQLLSYYIGHIFKVKTEK